MLLSVEVYHNVIPRLQTCLCFVVDNFYWAYEMMMFLLVTSCSVKSKCIQGFGFYGLRMTCRLKFDNLLGLVMFDIGVWACVPSFYL
jgi:hypothetical protein